MTTSDIATVADYLAQRAAEQPNQLALAVQHGRKSHLRYREYTYSALNQAADEIAAGLHSNGIKPGDHAAMLIPPGFACFATMFALLRLGAVPVCVDPGIGVRNLGVCLGEAEPVAFIGVPKAHAARAVLGWCTTSLQKRIVVDGWWPGCARLSTIRKQGAAALKTGWTPPAISQDDPAAVLFTSGSTGIPKGVVYHHRTFLAQITALKELFHIQPGEYDLPTFPLFALFAPALGQSSIIPAMDFTRPAHVDPVILLDAMKRYPIQQMFGSPALLDTFGRYLEKNQSPINQLQRILSAGAQFRPKLFNVC